MTTTKTVDRGIDGTATVVPCRRTHDHVGHWHRPEDAPSFVWCEGDDRKAKAVQAITDLATTIRIGTVRNTLVFPTLHTAEQAARLFLQARITCHWAGRNQPILTTASDLFAEKGGE